jgi:hypothetical protein
MLVTGDQDLLVVADKGAVPFSALADSGIVVVPKSDRVLNPGPSA